MNARQTAKKYKKLYENLLNQPVKFNVVTPKIDTLEFEEYFDEELLAKPEHIKYIHRGFRSRIADELVSDLNNYIKISTERQPHLNRYRLLGRIQVVNGNGAMV